MFNTLHAKRTLRILHGMARLMLPVFAVILTVACGWGVREARVPRPEPTSVPQPTFTPTPLPPTATTVPTATPVLPTDTPLPTFTPTPVLPTATSLPTDTPIPPTATSVPPTSTSVPPTPTPIPTATPVPAATATPVYRYEMGTWWKENNCYDLGAYGKVLDSDGDPIKGVKIEVVGSNKTFSDTSDKEGKFAFHLGSLPDFADGSLWRIRVVENGQVVSEEIEWDTTQNCDDDDDIQVLYLEWKRK